MTRPPFPAPRSAARRGTFAGAGILGADLAAALLVLPQDARASERCTAAMADWQPREALEQKLTDMGWQVRQVKIDDGCYEVYAIDAEGRRAEVYFDPQTLQPVGGEREDRDGDDDRRD